MVTISCIALVVVIGIFFFGKLYSKIALVALACITGGIAGNLYDRMFNEGRVRDFIDVNLIFRDYHLALQSGYHSLEKALKSII